MDDRKNFSDIPVASIAKQLKTNCVVQASAATVMAAAIGQAFSAVAQGPKFLPFNYGRAVFFGGNVGAFAFGRCSSTSEDSGFIIPSLVGAAMSGAFSAIYTQRPAAGFYSFMTWGLSVPLYHALMKWRTDGPAPHHNEYIGPKDLNINAVQNFFEQRK